MTRFSDYIEENYGSVIQEYEEQHKKDQEEKQMYQKQLKKANEEILNKDEMLKKYQNFIKKHGLVFK